MASKKALLLVALLAIIALGAVGFAVTGNAPAKPSQYDSFAQCLTEKGVVMYGAYWCPHCQRQKLTFGSSWQYVTYIECAVPGSNTQLPVCGQAGITGYPTWVFPDGSRLSGELSLQQLSEKSGCSLVPA